MEPNDTVPAATPLAPGVPTRGTIAPNEIDRFRITVAHQGRLIARVQPEGTGTRLSLLDEGGRLLVQSDGLAPDDPTSRIDQHVTAGTFYLVVGSLGGVGAYTLTTESAAASDPFQGLGVAGGTQPIALVVRDFDRDGILDVATANHGSGDVSVLLGGRLFQDPARFPVGDLPIAIVAEDFDGDGRLDLATVNAGSNDVSVLLQDDDGSFREQARVVAGESPQALAAGDFDDDGVLDLATANTGSGDVSVLRGRGDGSFQDPVHFAVGRGPQSLTTGDFDGDGVLDLAVVNSGDVAVLRGRGDGSFEGPVPFAMGNYPLATLAAGDFDGDNRLDLAIANFDSGDVAVLRGRGDGSFQDPVRFAVGDFPRSVLAGDFDGDGLLDLAVTNLGSGDVSVLRGRGDGTFDNQARIRLGSGPLAVAAADFDGDGRLDLAGANIGTGDVVVLRGRGDGTFRPLARFAVGDLPLSIVAGDFDGDGHLDLATANLGDVAVQLGLGDGSFHEQARIPVGRGPLSIVAGDFDGDGHLDLATANYLSGDVSVLRGRGDGTFRPQARFAVGDLPLSIVAGDFDDDGVLDLVLFNGESDDVAVLRGRGDGSFRDPVRSAVGALPLAIAAGDFDRDGLLDLVTVNAGAGDVAVLRGRGDGTFRPQARFVAGESPHAGVPPQSIVVRDFDGDSALDLAIRNFGDVSVLMGRGDGTFRDPMRFAVDSFPQFVTTGDFDGDGHLDLATANSGATTVAVLLGRGDGTFQDPVHSAVGAFSQSLAAGDFNGDGRLDLASVNSGDVSVLRGRGDGSFQDAVRPAVSSFPLAVVGGDFDGDGRLDLATANNDTGDVWVLRGRGDGSFQPQARFAVGGSPQSIVAGDFNGDGRLDLATANTHSGDVSVLRGRGDGSFQPETRFAVGTKPLLIRVGDFDGGGLLDLAITSVDGGRLLRGRGDGTFRDPEPFAVEREPQSLLQRDFDGDGRLDLAIANLAAQAVSVQLGRGDGTSRHRARFEVGLLPLSIVAGDFNGDGRLDLATANAGSNDISVGLNLGGGTFADPSPFAIAPRAAPLVFDLDRDGADDVLVINRAGEILWRRGRPQEPGTFESPLIVNPNVPSRDIAVFNSFQGPLIASIDAQANAVSLLAYRDGRFVRIGSLLTGRLPAQIATADLDGDGFSDLVVRNAADGMASVYLGGGFGNFRTLLDDLPLGLGASDLRLVDVDQSGTTDLIVTNQSSGDVRILYNRGDATFSQASRYPAGNGLYGLVDNGGTPVLKSAEETAGVAVGTFFRRVIPGLVTVNPLPVLDLVTINPGSNTLGVLYGLGNGAYTNPRRIGTDRPIEVVRAGDFNGDGVADVALLGASRVTISPGDGRGGFAAPVTIDAGLNPTDLSVADVDRDGRLDLLVGNDFGDLLVLLGDGDGTFRPFRKANRGVALAVSDLDHDGRKDFVFASQALDQVSVAYGNANPTPVANRSGGVLAPGAVVLADLTGDGHGDLIVANSGSNNVLIYPDLGTGRFGPALNGGNGFFAGTNPVGITVADVNVDDGGRGDGIPHLVVANRGSNDVSILLGRGRGADYTLVPGPRLQAGIGPVATVVQDVDGDRRPDVVVTNSLSHDVRVVPSVGGGFFADRNARIIPVGNNPGPAMVGNFDGRPGLDLVTPNRGSNDLTLVPDFVGGTGLSRLISSGGLGPVAGLSRDFNSDGFFDLVVANNGDGRLALLLGGDEGLSLDQVLTSPDLPHPTALALDSFGGGLLSFYASTEGLEAVTLLTFLLGDSGSPVIPPILPVIDTLLPMPLIPTRPGSIPPMATLVSLTDSALTLIATLLTVSLDTPATPIDAAAFADETSTPVPPLATATNPPAQATAASDTTGGDAGGTDASGNPPADDADPPPETPPAWVRLLVGLDEALERSRRASRDEVFPDDEPAAPAERLLAALDVLLDRWWPSVGLRGGLAHGWLQVGEDVARAIDEAIRSLWSAEDRASQSTSAGVDAPAAAAPVFDEPADPARRQLEAAEPVSVSLVVAAALVAYRISHPRRWRQGRRKAGPFVIG